MKVEISDKELQALEDIVEHSLAQEEDDCSIWCEENLGISDLSMVPEEDRTGHVYWNLLIAQKLVYRIKKAK